MLFQMTGEKRATYSDGKPTYSYKYSFVFVKVIYLLEREIRKHTN